jgi:hypothetical protein
MAAGGGLGEPRDQAMRVGGEGDGESDYVSLNTETSLAIPGANPVDRAVDPIVELCTLIVNFNT